VETRYVVVVVFVVLNFVTFRDCAIHLIFYHVLLRRAPVGDAMLEEYEGEYRGVYFQVDLPDGVLRQFLLPLDTFENQS
jgi:hypothetical protein